MPRCSVVLILVDDLGWRDLGCYGSSFYETPNIDRLAVEGVRFTDAYAACPVCSPSRAAVLTGKYPARLGLTDFLLGQARGRLLGAPYIDHLPVEETTVAQAFSEAGYATWHVGKWHLGSRPFYPEQYGFDVNVGGCSWGLPRNGYFAPWGIETLAEGERGEYLTDRLFDEAVRLIGGCRPGEPFFLNLWPYAVHIPIQAPEALIQKYRTKALRLGLDGPWVVEAGEPFPFEQRRHLRIGRRRVQSDPTYAAMIENLDWNVGRLLTALADAGREAETLIVLTSDNGGLSTAQGSPTCNAPLVEGKGWMYEGGVRVPLIVRGPGVEARGGVSHLPVTSTDLYPTVLDAAGVALRPEQHVDGVSVLPVLRGEALTDRGAIYWHFPHYAYEGGGPAAGVRLRDYKLIEFFETGTCELHNLRQDIAEAVDLAREEHVSAAELQERLHVWRERLGARLPLPNPEWKG